jgi:hypothetical protein
MNYADDSTMELYVVFEAALASSICSSEYSSSSHSARREERLLIFVDTVEHTAQHF